MRVGSEHVRREASRDRRAFGEVCRKKRAYVGQSHHSRLHVRERPGVQDASAVPKGSGLWLGSSASADQRAQRRKASKEEDDDECRDPPRGLGREKAAPDDPRDRGERRR